MHPSAPPLTELIESLLQFDHTDNIVQFCLCEFVEERHICKS